MKAKLSEMDVRNRELQKDLLAVRETLKNTELTLDSIQLAQSRILPQANGYVAMEAILAKTSISLVGKTLAQKLEYLLGELDRLNGVEKVQDARVAEILALRQQLDALNLVI